jgi:hypothetical protein
MNRIRVECLNMQVSVLGFGCASLGTRISSKAAQRVIDSALDRGIDWFDVAPPYGDGEAERLLGAALRTRREKVVVCTKFGLERPQIGPLGRQVRAMGRRLFDLSPALKKHIKYKVSTRKPIIVDNIEASVISSLRRLQTDYIDVLALHEPTLDEAWNSEIYEVLDGLIKKGIVRAISVAGTEDAALAAFSSGYKLGFIQFADPPFSARKPLFADWDSGWDRPVQVTHSIFNSDSIGRFRKFPAPVRAQLCALFDVPDEPRYYSDVIVRIALARNQNGIVLLSMGNKDHLNRNCDVADRTLDLKYDFERLLTGL